MNIRQAVENEYDLVMAFYYDLTEKMANAPYPPGWERDIYPTRAFIRDAISAGELTIAVTDEKIVGAMVLNQSCNAGYKTVTWSTGAKEEETAVIHALGVSPETQGQGIAKRLVQEAIGIGKERGFKSLRLDVLTSNQPARALYPACGFIYVDTVKMFYEDTGWTEFDLFELPLVD